MTTATTPDYTRPLRHRLPDWQLRLEAFLAQRRAQPFAWGINDCCTFAADAVQAITGQDPAPAGLRAHRTEKQALRALRRHGGVVGIATDAMGPPAPVSLACVGDVVVVPAGVGDRHCLAIVNGTVALMPSSRGLFAVGLDRALGAWRVA